MNRRMMRSGVVAAFAALVCKTNGSTVQGNARWYKLSHHRGYVSAHYVHAFRAVPWCRYLGN
ncbi:hypothetical protein WKI65_28520 [Streptomyces sp. MS1.AVA.3]|uniref:hypothetical protein n=1 Tax=Streptomyces decoyicus TaxID=249567 RepID=UPI0030BF7348